MARWALIRIGRAAAILIAFVLSRAEAQGPPPFAPPDPNQPPPLVDPMAEQVPMGPSPLPAPFAAPGAPAYQPPAGPNSPTMGPMGAYVPQPEHEIAGEFIDATQIIAQVGNQPILAGDLMPQIAAQIKQYEGQLKPEQMQELRERGLKQLLPQAVEQKLMYIDFLRVAPPDRLADIFNKIGEKFEEVKLKPLMKSLQVTTLPELEVKLRQFGSSIEKQRRRFVEQALAQEMIRRNVDLDKEITFDEMLAYYQSHIAEYQYPEQIKWEGMSISFAKIGVKRDAYKAMAALGNKVLGGAKFEQVARDGSHGPDAADGGQHDWTARGVLANQTIEKAIFALPEGRMSQILEDADGFYIVRVIERKPAGAEPFETAQAGIKEKIKKERIKTQSAAYIARLKERTRVWTLYDDAVIATKPGTQR